MDANQTAIDIKNLSFHRGVKCIYDNVDIAIPKNKITAVLGPSGTGKTTLLHLIGKLIKPTSGSITVLGNDVLKLGRKDLMNLRKRMGVLFQSGALFTHLSIYDNVAFPIRENTNLPESIIENIVLMKLEAVGLRGTAQMMPSELSGGMLRRAALARAIALDPEIMMYDEPFTGQDPISLGVVLKLIKSLNDSLSMTSIIISHDIHDVMSIADFVVVISNKKIVAADTPENIKNSDSKFLQQFLNGKPDGPVPFHYPAEEFI
ncbi:ATP-binding cassette domain-containing protein [Francisellaceae bacterium]|nr:ATP-binding cassette domain-containing protein [Francisellaceae bacterium]